MANDVCSIISLSIAEIIRVSTDDEFRTECYKLMNATDTNDCQMKINKKLLKIQETTDKRRAQNKRKAINQSIGDENSVKQEFGASSTKK